MIERISAVPSILELVCRLTGLRFSAVARVTETNWTACAVRDELDFGLKPGDELELKTTLCDEVRSGGTPIVIDNVSADPLYRDHQTPLRYGFQSYASFPIRRPNGEHFGTLCALDPRPSAVSERKNILAFELCAELIGAQLDTEDRLTETSRLLQMEQQHSQLREQFIAVLGHDLRNPLSSITTGAEVLLRTPLPEKAVATAKRIRSSGHRMAKLIDNLMDFARGRLAGGLSIVKIPDRTLDGTLNLVVAELISIHPGRRIDLMFDIRETVSCDASRLGQLLSNLLSNALTYGDPERPVSVVARCHDHQFILAVGNQGRPIPQDQQARLFEPYYRIHDGSPQEGLGLGLYIAAEIARAHDGRLTVESGEQGTLFTLTMPTGFEPEQPEFAGGGAEN